MTSEIKIYTLEEVAQILCVTRRSVYNYVKAGSLKAHKVGGQWRVHHEDLEKFTKKDK